MIFARLVALIWILACSFSRCHSARNVVSVLKKKSLSTGSSKKSRMMTPKADSDPKIPSESSSSVARNGLAVWGVFQVLIGFIMPLKKMIPIALKPIIQDTLTPVQKVACIAWCSAMTMMAGNSGIRKKFAPLVVKRAFGISSNPGVFNCILAGPYSMALFHAKRKRMLRSWGLATTMVLLSKLVKKLPQPWLSIADAGVATGLTFGAVSIVVQTVNGLLGHLPDADECLPESESEDVKKK